ncbi:hypothetical protein RYZ26_15470 [Terasakiella sp. A23]|uniref:hypothetical protein n=1 Tax=Terasakiella sp. FCG-A23 TaxID=3080561 RepID=UPI0029546C7A|nr:hypothetical protein [Terasakiella sp. A23]MDV7341005.1 hypothetical protein [Terasakiella sp. A23]
MSGEATHQNVVLRQIGPDACLTIDALDKALDIKRKAIIQACGKLVARGMVDRVDTGCFQLTEEGKMVFASGTELTSAPQAPFTNCRKHTNSMRMRIWHAMRLKQKFTIADLTKLVARDEKAPRDGVQRYLKVLELAGYLRPLRKSGREKRFSLIRDLGPEAPMIRNHRTEVYDPNTQEVFPCKR